MKLLSYRNPGCQWGIVIDDSVSKRQYVLDPAAATQYIRDFCGDRTVGYFLLSPDLFRNGVPNTMVEFLETGPEGMEQAARLKRFAELFIVQTNRSLLTAAAHELDEIEFLPPIPEPRLLWGLVGNVPSFARGKWPMKQLQLVPQGHQRPLGTVVPHNGRMRVPPVGSNVELGVVIGGECRNVEMADVKNYIAGFTIVSDMCIGLHVDMIEKLDAAAKSTQGAAASGNPIASDEIYSILSASWSGKYVDRMCPVGPWIVTPDEIGDPYDLLESTWRNGEFLGRGHTGGTLVGFERAISYYSRFATLYPGDIIHLGAVGKDGYSPTPRDLAVPDYWQGAEIEHIGMLKNFVTFHSPEEEKKQPPVPCSAANRRINAPADLDSIRLRNNYFLYGNSRDPEVAATLPPQPYPRFFCTPGSAVGTVRAPSHYFTARLHASAQLGAVIGRTCRGLTAEHAMEAVAGFTPLLVIDNRSMRLNLARTELAFERERAMPEMYGRWGDAANLTADRFVPLDSLLAMPLRLSAAGKEKEYDPRNYVLPFAEVISYISSYISLYPGDVIAFGELAAGIDLEPELTRQNSIVVRLYWSDGVMGKTILLERYHV